jgi:uncharacterized protein YfaT (DUF1175 family)
VSTFSNVGKLQHPARLKEVEEAKDGQHILYADGGEVKCVQKACVAVGNKSRDRISPGKSWFKIVRGVAGTVPNERNVEKQRLVQDHDLRWTPRTGQWRKEMNHRG